MKNRVEIALLILLALFVLSLGDPIVHIGSLLKRIPKLETSPQTTCIRANLPKDARYLFFSQADATVNWNANNFMITRTLYELAPSILEYREFAPVDLGEFQWFLAYRLDAPVVEQIARQNQLQAVQACGNITVLTRGR